MVPFLQQILSKRAPVSTNDTPNNETMKERRGMKLPMSFSTSAALMILVLPFALLNSPVSDTELGYLPPALKKCGKLCQVDAGKFEKSLYFEKRTVHVDCKAIFADDVFILRGHGQASAPRKIPLKYQRDYTLGGRITVQELYFDQMYLTKTADMQVWRKELVAEWIQLANNGKLDGNYGVVETNHLRHALEFAHGIKGGRVLVIGSENPWVEATVLSAGAKSVTTLEYGTIMSEHPSIDTLTPPQFQKRFQNGSLGLFDAIVTFSSVEHSGLGRYGDALNPWGDVLEIARAHCVCKDFGSLVIGVMTKGGNDALEFNAHRVYGSIRWPYLASNWQQIYKEPEGEQQVHVFLKLPH